MLKKISLAIRDNLQSIDNSSDLMFAKFRLQSTKCLEYDFTMSFMLQFDLNEMNDKSTEIFDEIGIVK